MNGKLYASSTPKEADVAKVEWREVFDFGTPQETVYVLAHGEPNETLYVSLVDDYARRGRLMKSPDGGKTWVELTLP